VFPTGQCIINRMNCSSTSIPAVDLRDRTTVSNNQGISFFHVVLQCHFLVGKVVSPVASNDRGQASVENAKVLPHARNISESS